MRAEKFSFTILSQVDVQNVSLEETEHVISIPLSGKREI